MHAAFDLRFGTGLHRMVRAALDRVRACFRREDLALITEAVFALLLVFALASSIVIAGLIVEYLLTRL